jgi:hypothetical protein
VKTADEFKALIAAAVSQYPEAAQFYRARDPRLLAPLDAMATMAAMLSSEMDVQAAEPFTKARDVTVLADAAVKGVLPFGHPTRAKIKITNINGASFPVVSGRKLNDTQGRSYVTDLGATIPANDFAYIEALQQSESSFVHTVYASIPFYQIAIPARAAGKHIVSIAVQGEVYAFNYVADFVNVDIGERTFHLETDETQQLYIQFGAEGIAGYQPSVGEQFTVTVVETEGEISLAAGSDFSLEYTGSIYENGAELVLDEILYPGASPMDIATLREVTNYPSIYDSSAVYLGNFDFLIRRNLSPFDFLSVWNEQTEERVRGADVDNINRLFVASAKDGVLDATLRSQIAAVIVDADDSYRITHVDIVEEEINIEVIGYTSPVYDFAAVAQQVRELILADYGQYSAWAKRGGAKIPYKKIYEMLQKYVQAFQGEGSDIRVAVTYTGNDDGEAKTDKAYTRSSTTVTVTFVAHGFVVGDALYIFDATDGDVDANAAIITSKTDDTFEFETTASGADGTLSIIAEPRPEKWRFVSDASLTVLVKQS